MATRQTEVRLLPPCWALLPSYESALERGWSPDLSRDVSRERLAALRADAAGFLRELASPRAEVELADGRRVARLPFRLFWISDGEFAGTINFRHQPGTEELPPHVSGHVGYSVVPWKQRRGYASRALALVLPHCRAAGMKRVLVTCDDDNLASRKVIEANGGAYAGTAPHYLIAGKLKLLYWIDVVGR
jgi:predicted acetyltransferase